MTSTQKKPRAARRRRKTTPKPMTSESYQVTKEDSNHMVEEISNNGYTLSELKEEANVVLPVVLPKPTDNIIPLSSYITDAKNRWKIHQYEIKALSKDITWTYDKLKPYLNKVRARFSPKDS